MRIPLFLTALSVAAVLAAGAVVAAEPKPAAATKPGAADKILTPAQLRDCMSQQAKTKQSATDLDKQRAALDAEKADIAKLGETIQAQLATIDRTSAEAIAAYNEQVSARQKRIDAYGSGVDDYNAKAETLNSDQEAYAKSCNNRRFLEDDETAIKKGK